MSDFGDALGTAAEGGLFARAVGGGTAAASPAATLEKGHFAEGACLNCGTSLIGAHCHTCGQQAHLHRTLAAFGHDLLHGALHLDGKTWKTLPLLLFRPGELTRRYIDGERARFVSPMALFLFSVFLMFAVFQAVGIKTPTDINTPDAINIAQSSETLRKNIAEAEARLAALPATDPDRGEVEDSLRINRKALEALGKVGGDGTAGGAAGEPDYVLTGVDLIDHGLIEKWFKHPELMLYKLQSNSYKFSWLLIPLSVPFMWLLFFWKRRFRAYDHAIFVTYSLAFMSLLFVAVSLLAAFGAGEDIWGAMLALIPPLHIYKQLRGTYGLSRLSALWRLAVLSLFITIVLALFLQLLLLIGAF